MNKVALISLRNDFINDRFERRDSLDIEIYSLVLELGFIPILIPNVPNLTNYFNVIFKEENIGLVLFTGGNDLYQFEKEKNTNIYFKRDKLELNLIKYCISNAIPILSICRGFQLIANYLGANIEKIENHVNINHEINFINSKEKIIVNSFHSYCLKNKNLPKQIHPIATNKLDNTIEAFKTKIPFKSLNIMWHPERVNGAKLKTLDLIQDSLINKID